MSMKHWFFGALTAAALAFGLSAPAHAGAVMCRPQAAATGTQAGQVGGALSPVPSGTLYNLNSDGCAAVSNQDLGYFRSQGYYPGTNLFSVSAVGLTANSTTATSPILPAGAFVTGIVLQETSGHAVTGGVNLGTASAGAQVVSAFACVASCNEGVTPASILLFAFPATGAPAAQQIFVSAVTAWNSASVNVTIFYSLYIPT